MTKTRQMICQDHRTRGRDQRTEHRPVTSNPSATFFRACPDEEFDRYYCGCFGWD